MYTSSIEAEWQSMCGGFAAKPDCNETDEKTSEIRGHVSGIGNNSQTACYQTT